MTKAKKLRKRVQRTSKKSQLPAAAPTRLCAVQWNGPTKKTGDFRKRMAKLGHTDLSISPQRKGCGPDPIVFTFVAGGDMERIQGHFQKPNAVANGLILFRFPEVPKGLSRKGIIRLLHDTQPPGPNCKPLGADRNKPIKGLVGVRERSRRRHLRTKTALPVRNGG